MLDPVNSYINSLGSTVTITSSYMDKLCTIVERAVFTLNQTPNQVLFSHRTNNRAILPGFNFSMDKPGNIAVLSSLGTEIKNTNVWILKKDGGLWRINCELINPDAKEFASSESLFGHSTALSDDGFHLVVGSPGYNEKEGRVYCFEYVGLSDKPYDLIQRLTPEYRGKSVSFGKSVAISADGEVLYVGVPHEEGGGTINTYNLRYKTYDLVKTLGKDSVYSKDGFGVNLYTSMSGKTVLAFNENNKGFVLFENGEDALVIQSLPVSDTLVFGEVKAARISDNDKSINIDCGTCSLNFSLSGGGYHWTERGFGPSSTSESSTTFDVKEQESSNIEIRLEKEKIDKLKDFASKLGMSLDELVIRILSNSEILN